MKNVLVLMPVEARHKEKIEAAGKGCSIVYSSPNQVTEEMIRSANVIFGNPKAEMIGASENLEWLQLESAGTDAYIVPGVLNAKTVLTNATGAYTKAVSEHAFALTLMLQKKLYLYRDEQKKAFSEAAAGHEIAFIGQGKLTLENAGDADFVIGNPPVSLVPELDRLKVLQLNSAGVDNYIAVMRELRKKQQDAVFSAAKTEACAQAEAYVQAEACVQAETAKLCNANGAYSLTISEHMLAMLLALIKKLYIYRDFQTQSTWGDLGKWGGSTVSSIYGSRVLVLGLGDIGLRFARAVKALGAHVIGVKRTMSEKPDYVDELYTIDDLDEVLPTADMVAMVLPETAQTRGILSAERIASMKQGAFVVNEGRGSAIDQDALVEALNSGHLGGAALDVTLESEELLHNPARGRRIYLASDEGLYP